MALEGTLQDMSLSDIFQVFRMGPKSGVLVLTREEDRGVIYVSEGRLIDAFIVRGAERSVVATSDESVLQMLTWEDGNFVFRHEIATDQRPVRIEHDAEWLVLEGMRRRADPVRTMPYHTITLDTELQLAALPSSAESGVSLDVDQWRVLSQVASSQNMRDICEATGIQHDKAIRIAAELLAIGLVEIAPPSQMPAPAPSPAPDKAAAANLSPEQAKKLELTLTNAGLPSELGKDSSHRPSVGRGLMSAIMRRIRDL
jgi:hypothetical protein